MRSFFALAVIGLAAAQKGRQTTEPVYTCPPQFELVGKTCTRQTTAVATPFCQQGILQANQCLIPAPRDSICPPGSVPQGVGCAITETLPAEKFCPPNTHDIGGECQTYSVTGIVEVCQRGVLIGGQCELTEAVPTIVQTSCPVGYEQAKGGCWKHTQMDCTPPHVGKRMLQAKGAPIIAVGKGPHNFVPAPIPVPKYVPQPAKLAVTSKQCEVKLEAPLFTQTSCPAGMQMIGNECITHAYEPTTIECSLGADYLCFPAQTMPANLRCPPGFTSQGELCQKMVNVPKNTFCPPGSIEAANGICMTPVNPPMYRCPPGSQLSGDVCLATETVQPTVQVTVTCQGKNCYRH